MTRTLPRIAQPGRSLALRAAAACRLAVLLGLGLAALPALAATGDDAAAGQAGGDMPVLFAAPEAGSPGAEVAAQLAAQQGLAAEDGKGLTFAAVDINGDGVAEIALRQTEAGFCFEARCETRILAYTARDWRAVFSGRTESLALSAERTGGARRLVVNGNDIWEWDRTVFHPAVPLADRLLTLPEIAYADMPAWVQAAVKDDADALEARSGRLPQVFGQPVTLGRGNAPDAFALVLDHVDRCSRVMGCPVLLLAPPVAAGGPTRVLLRSMGQDRRIALGASVADKSDWRDVALVTPVGLSLYRWQDAAGGYALVGTALPITAVDAERVTQ